MSHRQPSDYRFESEIQADLLAHFGSGHPMRIWRQNVGKAYPISLKSRLMRGESCRPVDYGQKGQADILGIVSPSGRGLAIEVKMPGERLRPEQALWRDMWVKYGGIYIVATCIEDVYVGLEKEGIKCR
jgi:hypothetical protein